MSTMKKSVSIFGVAVLLLFAVYLVASPTASAESGHRVCILNLDIGEGEQNSIQEGHKFAFTKRSGFNCPKVKIPQSEFRWYAVDFDDDGYVINSSYTRDPLSQLIPAIDAEYYVGAEKVNDSYWQVDISICENFTAYYLGYQGDICLNMGEGDSYIIDDWEGPGTLYNLDNAKLYES